MIKAVILDLDGTTYKGKSAVPGAPEALERLRAQGIQVLFLTNAATRSRQSMAGKISNMGLMASKEEMYTSSYFLAKYINKNHKGKKVYVVGEQGILDEFKELGIEAVQEDADIVAVGLDRQFTYEKLANALEQLQKGAILIASNYDNVFPTEERLMPGAGSIVAAVEKASGKKAHVVGKPNCYALDVIKEEKGLKNEEIIMIGDRLDTDITFAKTCGIKSALVLTGVSRKEDIKEIKPDYVFESIADFKVDDCK